MVGAGTPSTRHGRVRFGLVTVATLACTVAALLVAVASPAHAVTFSNAATITLPDPNCTDPDTAVPYPSTIAVSGLTGPIADVNLTLNGVSHTFQEDIDALVVGPAGQNLVVVSDAGNGLAAASNVTVTFDDEAAADIPQTQWGAPNSSVTYRPEDYDPGAALDTFPAPAPAPSAATALTVFDGTDGNGTWRLYLTDDACDTGGSIGGGWTLNITTSTGAATTTVLSSSPNPSTVGQNVTFTATVTTGAAVPVTTGTVTFTEGATTLAAGVPVNGSGQASFSTSTLPEGNHPIIATYNGTASFATSSGSVNQRVDNATVQTGTTYCNPGAITTPATLGAATPYPSNIFVTGATTALGDVNVQLKNVTHQFPEDMDLLLVGPAGQNIVLASDAGNGSSPATNVTLTLDDAAASDLPQAPWGAPNSSVTYRPKDYDPGMEVDVFAAPAPAPSAATALSTFNGTNANGTWSLYVVEDGIPDAGTIAGGWCLILSAPPQADVSVTKTDSPEPVVAGDNITYAISVSNSVAGSTATSVSFSDAIPANTTLVSFTSPGGWTCNSIPVGGTGTFTCTRASLTPAQGAQNFTLVVRVNNQTPTGTSISNTATVTATGDTTLAGNNVATTTTAVTFAASRPAVVRSSTNWKLRNTLTSGMPDLEFSYGTTPLVPIFGDWDGNGSKTPGTFESGTFKLNNANDSSAADVTFAFGNSRGFPVAGDFNGDGTDDVAVFSAGVWQVRYSTGTVLPDFTFGPALTWPRVVPVAGDWDGNGTDGIGFYNLLSPATPIGQWTLRATASGVASDLVVTYGGANQYPVVGDWNGDGIDTVGVKSMTGATWTLSNSNIAPTTAISFDYGLANDLPLAWRAPLT